MNDEEQDLNPYKPPDGPVSRPAGTTGTPNNGSEFRTYLMQCCVWGGGGGFLYSFFAVSFFNPYSWTLAYILILLGTVVGVAFGLLWGWTRR